jgi:hypothetical protein
MTDFQLISETGSLPKADDDGRMVLLLLLAEPAKPGEAPISTSECCCCLKETDDFEREQVDGSRMKTGTHLALGRAAAKVVSMTAEAPRSVRSRETGIT